MFKKLNLHLIGLTKWYFNFNYISSTQDVTKLAFHMCYTYLNT